MELARQTGRPDDRRRTTDEIRDAIGLLLRRDQRDLHGDKRAGPVTVGS